MEVHIMSIGVRIEHARAALRNFKYDKVYLIVGKPEKDEKRTEFLNKYKNSKKNASELKKLIEDTQGGAEIVEIPAFNKDSLTLLLNQYKEIIEKEKGNNIHINITGGTNLMGAAALSAAYFNNVNAYYVLDPKFTDKENLIVDLPIPKITYTNSLTNKQKFVLKRIHEKAPLKKMGAIVDKKEITSLQALKPHIESLEKMGLIIVNREKKRYQIELSDAGKVIVDMIK